MGTELEAVRFGYVTRMSESRQVVDVAQAAERANFHYFATGDTHTMGRDPFVLLALAAAATSTISLGTLVTNPSSRHPAAIANVIATVDEISGGRAFLGIGSGDNAVLNLGLRRATLAEMAEAIRAIRALTAGSDASYGGRILVNRWAHRSVPVMMSAEGPRSLQLAGGLADAVLIGTGLSETSRELRSEE